MGELSAGEVDNDMVDVRDADRERMQEGLGIFARSRHKVESCYAMHSIRGQEKWKQGVLAGLALGMLLSWIINRMTRPRTAALD